MKNETDLNEEDFNKAVADFCKDIAANFVRRNNSFYSISAPNGSISASDLKRIALRRFKNLFHDTELSKKLVREAFKHAIEDIHNDETQSIGVWDERRRCAPGEERLIPSGEFVSINTWAQPEYRKLNVEAADMGLLDRFLDRVFPYEVDRVRFKDWLAYGLQNETEKLGWAFLLYSRRKGTGKSTLCQIVRLLFGSHNCETVNGVTKITGKFNMTIITKKLIVAEEIQLRADSQQGNMLKTYITETETTSEAKGHDAEKVVQCCNFLFTTNHLPLWIEAGDRRYYVAEVDHEGHASGAQAEEFSEFVGETLAALDHPEEIAKLYNALMQHRFSNEFDPKSLNLANVDTPVMRQIKGSSQEVLTARLEEALNSKRQFAIPQETLARMFISLGIRVNRIRHLMNDLNWRVEKVKWGGRDYARNIWVHPDYHVDGGRVRGPDDYDQPIDDGPEVEIV